MSEFAVLKKSVLLPGSAIPATVKADSTENSNVDIEIDFDNFYVNNFNLTIRKSIREDFGVGITALKFIANAHTKIDSNVQLVVQKEGLDGIFPMFTENGYKFESILVFQSADEGAMTAYCYAPSDKGNLYISDTVEFSYLDTFADEEPDNTPPGIIASVLHDAATNQPYSYQLTASNTPQITWTLQSGRLPAGLILSDSCLIFGTPTKAGKSSFTLKATNAYGTASQRLTLQVFDPAQIVTASLKDAVIGKNYSAVLKGKGTRPITWSAEGLPESLSINGKSGRISGKPSVYGKFNVKVKAENGAGIVEKTLLLTVKAIPPKISRNYPRAELNTSYSAELRLEAGSTPVTWSIEGALPEGLTFDPETGAISGIPTEAGRFKVSITATNDGGTTRPRTLTYSPCLKTGDSAINGSCTLASVSCLHAVRHRFSSNG